jgi:hypothetical protein
MGSHPHTSMALRRLLAVAGTLLVSLAFASGAYAANFTADDLDDATSDGTCDATCTIRDALDDAEATSENDVITVVAGTHELQGDLEIGPGSGGTYTLQGAGAGTTTVDANGNGRAFSIFPNTTVTMTGMTIQGGDAFDGGGIANGGQLTLDGVVVRDNQAIDDGGGIANALEPFIDRLTAVLLRPNLTIRNSTIGGPGQGDGNEASEDDGGGVYNDDGDVTIENSTIEGNQASGDGGGISNDDESTMTATGCRVINNLSFSDGGGIATNDDTTMTLSQCLVSGNRTTDEGAGIKTGGSGPFTITESTISANFNFFGGFSKTGVGEREGAGIYNEGDLDVVRTTITGNGFLEEDSKQPERQGPALVIDTFTVFGGGIYNERGGQLSVVNSTLSRNAALQGGALNNQAGDVEDQEVGVADLLHVTMTLNRVLKGTGAGIYNEDEESKFPAQLSLKSVILSDNTLFDDEKNNCDGAPPSSGGTNLEDADTCGFGSTPGDGDLTNTNPVLGPLADNGGPTQTHALLSGSPAIHAANNTGCPGEDQRNVTRPQGPACDIGAYEVPVEAAGTPQAQPGPAPGPPAARAAKPRVRVAGVRRACVRTSFRATLRITAASGTSLTSVRVTVDGRRVRSTTRSRFSVTINVRRLKAGRHRLRIVATDSAGNRTTVNRSFTKCAAPAQRREAPRFTG